MATADDLARVPLFAGLSDDQRGILAEWFEVSDPSAGTALISEGAAGYSFYVLLDGAAEVTVEGETVATYGPGDFFGEMAILDDGPRSAHVIAMEESNLLILRRDDFYARIRAMPEVAISLLKEISRRLRRADEKIGSLVLLDVNGRLAHLLLRLAEEEQGDRITRRLTHHTIAQMIGSSRETVSRAMRGLVERSVIEVTRSDILLRDRTALRSALRRERATAVPRPA